MRVPVICAPMAGGVTTPALVATVGNAGGLGFLAAGYKTAAQVAGDIAVIRRLTTASFGVNLFVPPPEQERDLDISGYAARLAPEAARLGTALGSPADLRDDWDAKLELLLADPVPAVSFTFGCPSEDVIRALQRIGTMVIVTVTRTAEARLARHADVLCVQGPEAGGHRGTFSNADSPTASLFDTVSAIQFVTDKPIVAAGGLTAASSIRSAFDVGAAAVQLGTAFLRSPESGAAQVHKNALASPEFDATIVTRAFSGRPARGLRNRFVRAHHNHAPHAYPQVHHLTAPLRKASAAQDDPDGMALWAGTGFRYATTQSAAEIVLSIAHATDPSPSPRR
jgi:nitronate monooxygenase